MFSRLSSSFFFSAKFIQIHGWNTSCNNYGDPLDIEDGGSLLDVVCEQPGTTIGL